MPILHCKVINSLFQRALDAHKLLVLVYMTSFETVNSAREALLIPQTISILYAGRGASYRLEILIIQQENSLSVVRGRILIEQRKWVDKIAPGLQNYKFINEAIALLIIEFIYF